MLPFRLAVVVQVTMLVTCEFTPDFNQWLTRIYGADVQKTLERLDLGTQGSFGGKSSPNERLVNQPVVFVHGVSSVALSMKGQAIQFIQKGQHRWSEMYATTYADGAKGNPLQWLEYSMKCAYVKQVRALIVAVRLYTGRMVDVVGFSLGVTVARKAILGGKCVDTGEQLGRPLTKFIDTFVGIAGANQGVAACIVSLLPICNPTTGLFSGICPTKSAFLQDVNAISGYEAGHIYSILTKIDDKVGYLVCDRPTSAIAGQEQQFVYERKSHDQVLFETADLQRNLVLLHHA